MNKCNFLINEYIYKKKYIHQKLETDYDKLYMIKNISVKKEDFGTSYLALLDNEETYELAFYDKKTKVLHSYAEKYNNNCVCF